MGIGEAPYKRKHIGCRKDRIKPKYRTFGDITDDNGVWRDEHTAYVTAANVDGKYYVINMPIALDFYINNNTIVQYICLYSLFP